MTAAPRRTGVSAAAFLLLVCATLWALYESARLEFTAYLRNQAAESLALAASGGTPHRWQFRSSQALVARRPFGAAAYRFVDAGLQLQAATATIEVGLARSGSIDLRSFPLMRIVLDAGEAGDLRVLLRASRRSPVLTSSPLPFPAGTRSMLTVDLRQLDWHAGDAAVPAPARAAMLRLRISPAAHGSLLLRSASLLRPANFAPLDLTQPVQVLAAGKQPAAGHLGVYRLQGNEQTRRTALRTIAAHWQQPAVPLFVLSQNVRVEQQMITRSDIRAVLPEAILIPGRALDATFAQARELAASGPHAARPHSPWPIVVLFGFAFLLARLRPPRNLRIRASIEIALTLGAPLWLILGGNTSGNLHAPHVVAILLTVGYAISLSIPRDWHWIGAARAWWYASAVVLLALSIGLAMHAADGPMAGLPDLRHLARYLVWALLQQYLICAVCTERWKVVTGKRWAAAYLGALGFALLHTPNGALMLATFVGGLCWCAIWLRYRALLPLAFSHAASALLLTTLLPPGVLHSAEVSLRYFQ